MISPFRASVASPAASIDATWAGLVYAIVADPRITGTVADGTVGLACTEMLGCAGGGLWPLPRRHHATSGDGFEQPPVVLLVLPGVCGREVRDGVVEDLACAQVTGDHAGPPGPRVRSGERPATELAVVVKLERVHERDAHAAFHVTELAHVVLLAAGAIGVDATGPAEERIGGGLGQALADDNALALVAVFAGPGEGGQHRLLRLLQLQEQRLIGAVTEQQHDERLGSDRPDADDLAREVAEVVMPQHLAPIRFQRVQVACDGAAQLSEDVRVALDGE